jgi:hypothetical protein
LDFLVLLHHPHFLVVDLQAVYFHYLEILKQDHLETLLHLHQILLIDHLPLVGEYKILHLRLLQMLLLKKRKEFLMFVHHLQNQP